MMHAASGRAGNAEPIEADLYTSITQSGVVNDGLDVMICLRGGKYLLEKLIAIDGNAGCCLTGPHLLSEWKLQVLFKEPHGSLFMRGRERIHDGDRVFHPIIEADYRIWVPWTSRDFVDA